MKNKLLRIISSLLILAFLVSCFAIYSFAEEGDDEVADGEEENNEIEVVYYRNYEEGWGYENGFNSAALVKRNNTIEIRYEETDTFDYNYYVYFEGGTPVTHGYMEVLYGAPVTEGYTILEWDLKIDDYSDFQGTNLLDIYTGASSPYRTSMTIKKNALYLPTAGTVENNPNYKIATLSPNNWVHVAMVFCLDYRECNTCGTKNSVVGVNNINSTECINDGCTDKINEMEPIIELTVYFSNSDSFDPEGAIDGQNLGSVDKDLSKTYKYTTVYKRLAGEESKASCSSVIRYRIQVPSHSAQVGQNYCFDNLAVYNGSAMPVDIASLGTNGYLVDTEEEKIIEILGGADSVTNKEYIDEGIAMKVGVDYALNAGTREPILVNEDGKAYGAPVKKDGKIYVPLDPILENIGYPIFPHTDGVCYDISTDTGSTFIAIGRDTATVNGELVDLTAPPAIVKTAGGDEYMVIALDDVERLLSGYFVTYDEMGLIIIAAKDNVVSRSIDLEYMLELMQSFVFEEKDGDAYYALAKEKTNFDHPYLIADDTTFATMRSAYALTEGSEGYDANYKSYLNDTVTKAETVYANYANEFGGLKAAIINPYLNDNNGGYNKYNGTLDAIADYAAQIRDLALAYQITTDTKYATLAYDMALSLGEWEHWGPASVSTYSEAVTAYALAYDWLYDAWTNLDCNVAKIETALYEKSIYQGYNISTGICVYTAPIQDYINPYYNTLTSSANVIGTSGMIIASLALLGIKDLAVTEERYDESIHDSYVTTAKWILENNMQTLVQDGLDTYAPDGSFFEGPAMWAKSTNALFLLAWALDTAIGDDMGLLDTWGLDKTFYYAVQIEYPALLAEVAGDVVDNNTGYLMWNYNNAEAGPVDTSIFYYAASALGDNNLAALRTKQLEKKAISYLDLLGYKTDYATLDPNGVELSLDYELQCTDGVVSRDSWSDGCLYVGIMGGANSGSYAQIDSGNFIYANHGFTWFGDMGAENPDAYGTASTVYAYKYYRANAEGANVVCIVSDGDIPYGQLEIGSGKLTDYEVNEYGMYAVIDNSSVYGDIVNSAKRGLLFTNDRKTVVVQDEISFSGGVHSAVWVANTAADRVSLSEDAKTAYLRQKVGGQDYILRATIVSTYDFVFEKLSATDDYLLPNTMKETGSTSLGGAEEYSRSEYSKLVIRAEDRLGFECAVVFEIIKSMTSNEPVEYEYTNIAKWKIEELFVPTVSSAATRTPELNDVVTFGAQAGRLIQQKYAFTTKLDDFFYAMANVQAAVKTYRPAYIKNFKDVYASYEDYLIYLDQYNVFKEAMNEKFEMSSIIGAALCGIY